MTDTADLVERLTESLARATPVHLGWHREDRGDGEERYVISGKPCGFPITKFGDANDAKLFLDVHQFLPTLLESLSSSVAEVERLRAALEPFSTFAEQNTDEDGWAGTRCEGERIRDWFGPTDFRRARAALAQPSKG